MKTKKTRQELERKNNNILGWIIIGLVCLFVFWMIMDEAQINRLKTQLSECQEQVPVWTLETECYYPDEAIYVYGQYNFTNYLEYLEIKESLDEIDVCEVIE